MNLFYFLPYHFHFLDLAPMQPMTYSLGTADSTTKAIVIGILILFLGFVGYLIWQSIRKRKDDM